MSSFVLYQDQVACASLLIVSFVSDSLYVEVCHAFLSETIFLVADGDLRVGI